jgi:carboxypeptidase PM20D1
MDWTALRDETVQVLCSYLSIDKALARALEARRPDGVVAPQIMTGFTDNWIFRECGLVAYGWSPLRMGEDELGRVHGNDERVAVDDLRSGVRTYTEMLLDVAAA